MRGLRGRLDRIEARLGGSTLVIEVPYGVATEVALAQLGVGPDTNARLVVVQNFAGLGPRLAGVARAGGER